MTDGIITTHALMPPITSPRSASPRRSAKTRTIGSACRQPGAPDGSRLSSVMRGSYHRADRRADREEKEERPHHKVGLGGGRITVWTHPAILSRGVIPPDSMINGVTVIWNSSPNCGIERE